MSRSQSEALPAPASALRVRSRQWAIAVRRAIGRAPCRTVYAGTRGACSWSGGSAAAMETHADTSAWFAANPGADARLVISGHLLHNLVVDPALGLGSEDEVRQYARQQFVHYHGAPARDWSLAPWAGAAGAGVCALHSLDLDGLRTVAARYGVRLRNVAPAWSAGLASLSAVRPSFGDKGRRALAVVEGETLTWLVVDSARIVQLQQRFLDAPDVPALAALLDELVAEDDGLAEPPFVIGWDLRNAEGAELPSARLLRPLHDRAAAMHWLHDTLDGSS